MAVGTLVPRDDGGHLKAEHLGERESGTVWLEEAVQAFRAAQHEIYI